MLVSSHSPLSVDKLKGNNEWDFNLISLSVTSFLTDMLRKCKNVLKAIITDVDSLS